MYLPALDRRELWIGEMRGVCLRGARVLLLRLDEGIFAFEDRCAHLGMPLSQGKLEGTTLTCAAHHFQYDARTGRGINPKTAALVPRRVKLQGEVICVEVPKAPEASAGERRG